MCQAWLQSTGHPAPGGGASELGVFLYASHEVLARKRGEPKSSRLMAVYIEFHGYVKPRNTLDSSFLQQFRALLTTQFCNDGLILLHGFVDSQ